MSGGVYCPGLELLHLDLASLELSDALNWNPLHCLLCQESLCEPVALPCFHVFCRNCIVSRRDKEQRIKCPLCGYVCKFILLWFRSFKIKIKLNIFDEILKLHWL